MSPVYSIREASEALGREHERSGHIFSCAESCTGGLIGGAVTETAGSSAWFDRGFITYSNEAKQDMLNVSAATLKTFGAVSRECAEEMAVGALKNSLADCSVSVTGIAGPSGGSDEKPVGTVCFGLARKDADGSIYVCAAERHFTGDREEVRNHTVYCALEDLCLFSTGKIPADYKQ